MEYVFPTKKGAVKSVIIPKEVLNSPNITETFINSDVGNQDIIIAPIPEGFEYLFYISAKGATKEEAQSALKWAISKVEIVY